MDVLVFGAGSLGSLIGGLLARDNDVTLVGRDPHVSAIRQSGLRITGEFDVRCAPTATTEVEPGTSSDLAVVTVKAFDTAEAARVLAGCDLDAALSLQNGMGNEETLAGSLSCPVLAGTTSLGARLREPGVVACTGVGPVDLGPHGDAPSNVAERAGATMREAGLETTVHRDICPILWRKLAVNAGINPVTALAGVENGGLASDPLRGIAERAATETAAVARDHGIDVADEAAREALLDVVRATARNVSSMRADLEAGRRTEIDAITGAVVEHATRPVPVNETLYGLVRARSEAVEST